MATFIFNWQGLVATIVVGIPAFWTLNRLEAAGWTVGPAICFLAIAMTLPLSLFAYAFDRCDRPGVLRPYWDNTMQVFAECYGGSSPDYNPDRRTAFCLWPLALGPYIIFMIYLGTWLYWAFTGDVTTLLPYLACTAGSCVIAALFGKMTEGRRLIIIDLPD